MRKNRENRRKEREERARELLKDMGYVLEQTSDEVAAGNNSPFPLSRVLSPSLSSSPLPSS